MQDHDEKKTRVAAYGLLVKEEKILLCRLSKDVSDKAGYWTLPGGGLDFGESPEEAMMREVKEETGLSVKPKALLAVDSLVIESGDSSNHGIRIIYQAHNIKGEISFEENGTSDKCQWFKQKEAKLLPLVSLAEKGLQLAFK